LLQIWHECATPSPQQIRERYSEQRVAEGQSGRLRTSASASHHGELPDANPRLRRNALRIARFIEYAGPLRPLEGRETLIECKRRPDRRQCLGLFWVMKRADDCTGPQLRLRAEYLRPPELDAHTVDASLREAAKCFLRR
jgi:hypothetical protein